MEFAPVLISVIDRDIHFKNCVTSLAQNPLAKETHLFIALDAPLAEKHKTGHARVLSFIENIEGFKKVTLFKREKNMGSSPNQFLAMEDIFKQYDRLIFTEDDNVFSPNFLDFINQGLDFFKDRQDVFSITGYNYLVDMPKSYTNNYYVFPGFEAWGVGMWREKWNNVDFSVESCRKNTPLTVKNILKINAIAGVAVLALFDLAQFGVLHDDFALGLHMLKNNMYSIFPTISKVRNKGLDGSGENGGVSGLFDNQYIDESDTIQLRFDEQIKPNPDILRIIKKFKKLKYKKQIKLLFRYLQFKLFQTVIPRGTKAKNSQICSDSV